MERFSGNTKEIAVTLQDAIAQWQSCTLPNDVESTTILLEDHSKEQQELKDDIRSAIRHGETLLSCIRRPSEEEASLDLCPDKLINVAAVERLLIQLDETQKNFDIFWDDHKKKLEKCLQLRHFEQNFKEVHGVLSGCLDKLGNIPISGDSAAQVQEVLQNLEDFETSVQVDLNRSLEVKEMGENLISDNHFAVDSIAVKSMELDKMVGDFKHQLQHKLDMLRKYYDLHEKNRKGK